MPTNRNCSRRRWLQVASAAAGAAFASPRSLLAADAPTAPVAIAKCTSYGAELLPAMRQMFDQLGGLGKIVRNKTVAIKINLTGGPGQRLGHVPAELAHWTHPAVIGTTVRLMGEAGATRVRLLESPWNTPDPIEEYIMEAGWDPSPLLTAASRVEFENTNYLGRAKQYARMKVPGGGHIFPAFDLNHSYQDCDVFVSIAKLKDHATAGVTLSMKNCFGMTPCTIYGDHSGVDEPSATPKGGRGAVMHAGERPPSKSALPEHDPRTPRDAGYRVPRIVADLVAARPIHLAIIDGIETMAGGEGPWIENCVTIKPNLLVAGTNCVTTDAVATALMGYDPMADRGAKPFEQCDSTLRLAEAHGLGTRDLRRIEILGPPIATVKSDFRRKA